MKLLTTFAFALLTACAGSTPPAHQPEAPAAAPVDKTLRGHGDSSSVAFIITLKIKPEAEKDFLDLAAKAVDHAYNEEPGTLVLTMYKHPTEPNTYVWIERYQNLAARDEHVKTPYLMEAHQKLPTWLAAPPTVIQYDQALPK